MSDSHDLRELEKDPRLFLYTSLTAGSSHIITATSRLETILKANRVPFQAIDVATDEKARRLWQRRAGKRKLPGLVKDGFVIGDLEEVEEWNEYGELKENIGTVPGASAPVSAPKLPIVPTATGGTPKVTAPDALVDMPKRVALPGAAEIAARNKPLPKSSPEEAVHPKTMISAPAEKERSIEKAIRFKGEDKHVDHLSVPASAIPSTTPTPTPERLEEDTKAGAEAAEEVVDDKEPVEGLTSGGSLPTSKDVGTSDTTEKTIEEAATVSVEEDVQASAGPAGDAVETKAASLDDKTPSAKVSQQGAIAEATKDEAVTKPESKQSGNDDLPTATIDTQAKGASVDKIETSEVILDDTTNATPAPATENEAMVPPSDSKDEPVQETTTAPDAESAEASETTSAHKENALPLLPAKSKAGTDTQPKQEKSLPSLPTKENIKPETKTSETRKQAAVEPDLAVESVED